MDAPSTTPHDAVFKQFLMHAETARDFWRDICQWNYENFVTSTRFI
ncbi:Rpn family recombination-promoting nuclease/putative transposase [Escherichia coli]